MGCPVPQAPLLKKILQLVKRKYVGSYLCARLQSSFCKAHAPTGQSLPPWETWPTLSLQAYLKWRKNGLFGVNNSPTGHWRIGKNRVLSPNNGVRTLGWNNNRLRDQLHLAARQQERHRLDLCLHGTSQLSLLVNSVSLVSSCNKKWTCPPDNHVRTFDLSGDILACLGQTDWPYLEPWDIPLWCLKFK